ncbi:MAG: hypothetical protein HFH08_06275 [Bacilli bacterium]|nr:hypothetical protein [Bacilli bacterium]
MPQLLEVGTTAASAFDFSTIDLSQVVPTVTAAIAVAIPISLSVSLIKKGARMVISWVKGA